MIVAHKTPKLRVFLTILGAMFICAGLSVMFECAGAPSSRKIMSQQIPVQNLADRQVVLALKSHNKEEAHKAAQEVFNRGERMIPLLLQRMGDKHNFYGYGLGNRAAAFYSLDRKLSEGSSVTVEVAALYLICAIYHQNLEFAQAPYLTDGSNIRNMNLNTNKRVRIAWIAVQNWAKLVATEGLASLRSRRYSPLTESTVWFW
jgi:hypothetical protein